MSQEKVKNIIEAALMVASQPLNLTRLLYLFEEDKSFELERSDIRAAVEELQQDYLERGIELVEVASGYRIQAKEDYSEWVNRLFDERPPRYSRALLETLAIIAYRQPITRAEIEEIRGVSVSSTIVKTLQEREWIKVVGQRDVPGKPSLLATTKLFLDYFNLKKLSDLPALADIKDFDSINPDLFESLEKEGQAEAAPAAENNETQSETEVTDETDSVELVDEPNETAELEEVVDEESNSPESEQADTSEAEDNDSDAPQTAKVIPFNN